MNRAANPPPDVFPVQSLNLSGGFSLGEIKNSAANPPPDVFPVQSLNLSGGFFSTDQMLRAFSNFKNSGAPSRFLLFIDDAWVDFARQVFDELKLGFLAGKTTLEVTMEDCKSYLFDFLRMVRIDSDTGRKNSIAWIDVHGRCFFPNGLDDRGINPSQRNLELRSRIDHEFLMSSPSHSPPELCDESAEVSSDRWPGAKLLRNDEKSYKVAEQLFISGIKRFIPNVVISSIHRCSHSSMTGNSRLSSFLLEKRSMVEARGNANVKFGWFGTSADEIAGILLHGFRHTNSHLLGSSAHGVGIHLSPPQSPYSSALLSEADGDGERHLILCRVILGNSEKVEAGSRMSSPRNEMFDSGVDDLVNPKWFVVWTNNMSTHIIPEYIVSFKSSGCRKPTDVHKLTSSKFLSFLKLFTGIEKSLSSSKMQALETLYNQYKVGKISKEIFIRHIRSIAGDKLLISTIRSLKGQLKM